ncbi:Wadjet anti-phage system protein JetD domain-containing protein [Kribbella sp. GL6]|uniref:Wadjet anti-phage system protein JetD domain-containing protein n=1 Tax=Kribbella sp. GL6 TaxID=3419765 RepID=UPI003D064EF6
MSALARHLAEQVAAAPAQQIAIDVLYTAAVAFDRSLATAPMARSDLGSALDELVAEGLVTLPKSPTHYDRRDSPPLPAWVRRPPRPSRPREQPRVRVWPPALETAGLIATRDGQLAVLEIVAAFLRDGGERRPSVPVRERSLELFGDEKRLDSLVSTRLFTSGALSLALLRCQAVPIPFVSQWVPGPADPRGTALLIAENHHTYVSLLRVTREGGGPGRHIGYGTGNQFPSAVLSVPLLEPAPERIVYFGDIDLQGLQIPAAAQISAQRAGLPAVVPALPLYELLFAAPYRRPSTRIPASLAVEVAGWLGPLADRACEVLTSGHRIPQEAVGYELLTSRRHILDAI